MENPRCEEEKIIKELNDAAIKDVRNIFILQIETKAIRDRILRDIKKLLEHEEEEIIGSQ